MSDDRKFHDQQKYDLLQAAEAFRRAMIESGAVNHVSQDSYIEQLRALERVLNPLNYRALPPEDPDHRAECDRYMKSGGIRRAFVTILEPGKIPDGKGPFLTVEHLDRFVKSAIERHPDPATHIMIHQLTWDGELWTGCARERAAIDAALDGVDPAAMEAAGDEEGEH
ncbi:hypothetical protein PMI42_04840 [Bradyrhizobium sp. YR681]|uniref:hypothetical protein n=1 Tax=Bradyrhizobium sp. YR681 TaxID=1144344 RepID=UPI0002710D2E|nr:hypothetical protein [Bradyrhizobium sp. YR681]EJN11826.1 hypothetical protein PMI42_04840 [Bradyrhizobium sp. YR681]